MVSQQDRRDGVRRHALPHGVRQLDRPRVEAQQRLQHRGADHAALVDGGQDGELVVVRLAEAATVVQVEGEGQVAKDLEQDNQCQCVLGVLIHTSKTQVALVKIRCIEVP